LIYYSNWPYTPPADAKDQPNGNTISKYPTTTQAIILGLGSMFNHSTLRQNVGWERDLKKLLVTYTALRDIKAGEELCISYGSRLTFKDTDQEELKSEPEDWTEIMGIIEFID
jgi:SET domain-containing protein